MAHEIRAPADFLTAVAAVVEAPHGRDVFAALGVEMERRRSLPDDPPLAWTLEAALAELAQRPHAASLFGAIRLLQGAQPDKPALGYALRAEDDTVRIDQKLLLGFAASEVDLVQPTALGRPRLVQSAVGLLGPNGVLPFRWTEHAFELANNEYRSLRDISFHAWINLVQRRQIALLFRAWSDARSETGAERPGQSHPIADRLRALSGLVLDGLRGRDGIDDGFKMAFSATLSRRVRNPGPLAAMLSKHFEAPVRIEEFVSHWLEIPVDQRSVLGHRLCTLGEDAVVGARVWDSMTRFRIVLGPLSLERYRSFLPVGPRYAELRDLVSLYVGAENEWDLVPLLEREEVPYSWAGNPGLLLGWSSWLGVRYEDVDAGDLSLPMTPRLGVAVPERAAAWADFEEQVD